MTKTETKPRRKNPPGRGRNRRSSSASKLNAMPSKDKLMNAAKWVLMDEVVGALDARIRKLEQRQGAEELSDAPTSSLLVDPTPEPGPANEAGASFKSAGRTPAELGPRASGESISINRPPVEPVATRHDVMLRSLKVQDHTRDEL